MARVFSYTCRRNVSGLVHDLGVPSATKPDGHNNACTCVRRFDFCALGRSCVSGLEYLRAASERKKSVELIWRDASIRRHLIQWQALQGNSSARRVLGLRYVDYGNDGSSRFFPHRAQRGPRLEVLGLWTFLARESFNGGRG
ncbi:hypothetical protein R1flu_016888 [Riccia fluitans]|uniref:Uncharacterized protein n=1 Tax=Riccia fluitans TaxID=41844 RepID=A0ABD1YR57_9MARC